MELKTFLETVPSSTVLPLARHMCDRMPAQQGEVSLAAALEIVDFMKTHMLVKAIRIHSFTEVATLAMENLEQAQRQDFYEAIASSMDEAVKAGVIKPESAVHKKYDFANFLPDGPREHTQLGLNPVIAVPAGREILTGEDIVKKYPDANVMVVARRIHANLPAGLNPVIAVPAGREILTGEDIVKKYPDASAMVLARRIHANLPKEKSEDYSKERDYLFAYLEKASSAKKITAGGLMTLWGEILDSRDEELKVDGILRMMMLFEKSYADGKTQSYFNKKWQLLSGLPQEIASAVAKRALEELEESHKQGLLTISDMVRTKGYLIHYAFEGEERTQAKVDMIAYISQVRAQDPGKMARRTALNLVGSLVSYSDDPALKKAAMEYAVKDAEQEISAKSLQSVTWGLMHVFREAHDEKTVLQTKDIVVYGGFHDLTAVFLRVRNEAGDYYTKSIGSVESRYAPLPPSRVMHSKP